VSLGLLSFLLFPFYFFRVVFTRLLFYFFLFGLSPLAFGDPLPKPTFLI